MRLTFKRRHVHLPAQRRDRKGNRNFTIKIIAVALKDFVLPDVYDDIKIALRATANTGLPIARGAQPRTLADSGRNLQFNAAQFFHAPLAMAVPARLLEDLSGAATARTCLRNLKESARTDHLPTAATNGTCNASRTGLSAATLTFIAGLQLRDFNFFFDAKRRLLQRDLHIVTQIGTTLSILRTRGRAPKECLENAAADSAAAENFTENIEWIMKTTAAETRTSGGEGGVAETVVGRPFIRVDEDIVSFAELLKFFLGMGVIGIFVRMKLDRELAISAIDFLLGNVVLHNENFIIIAFGGGHFQTVMSDQ